MIAGDNRRRWGQSRLCQTVCILRTTSLQLQGLGIGYWVLGIGYWVLGIGDWRMKIEYTVTRSERGNDSQPEDNVVGGCSLVGRPNGTGSTAREGRVAHERGESEAADDGPAKLPRPERPFSGCFSDERRWQAAAVVASRIWATEARME